MDRRGYGDQVNTAIAKGRGFRHGSDDVDSTLCVRARQLAHARVGGDHAVEALRQAVRRLSAARAAVPGLVAGGGKALQVPEEGFWISRPGAGVLGGAVAESVVIAQPHTDNSS